MTESVHPVLAAAATYRRQLLQREDAAVARLVTAYGTAYQRAGVQIQALREILTDQPMTRRRAGQLAQLRALRQQIETELERFGIIADNEFNQLTQESIRMGLQHSAGLIESYFASPQARQAITASLTQLVPEQVETLLGFLAPDSPLRAGLTTQLGPAIAQQVSDKMIDGMVRGFNPNKTATIIRTEMGVGLSWAINTVRTANLWAYREATRANYVANQRIVSGWTWYATLGSDRTCMSCIAKHGGKYPVDAVLNDHHMGRCTQIPSLRMAEQLGITPPEIEPGEKWFKRQNEATQRQLMGPAMFDAWKANAIRFSDLSQTYDDPVYGTMTREASLKELLGERAKEYYKNGIIS